MLMSNLCKKFCETVSEVFFDRNVGQLNMISRDFISYKMIADIEVLSAIILNEILPCFYSTHAIHVDKNEHRGIKAIELEISKKLL